MTDTEHGDPTEWDDEWPGDLHVKVADELTSLGWNVTTHHVGGIEISLPGGHETGVWLAGGGRLWTGLIDPDGGGCRNPIQITADPADPEQIAANADPLLREIAARAAKMPPLDGEDEPEHVSTALLREAAEPGRYCVLCERVEYGPMCPNQRTDGRQP